MTGYGAAIFPQHAKLLAESAISPDVARERGYVTAAEKRRLATAGFKPYQQRTPGLLIPVHDTSGAVALWQYRPDSPRMNGTGKAVKYETPGGSRMVMDVPPRIRGQLPDPKVALWVTEGIRKADAAVSAGLCCVALLGVHNWKGTNTLGGKTALPAWHDIALEARRVYVAYDSDVMTNPKVHSALADIGGYLTYKKADVRYCYLPADGDAKVGLDDYPAAGGSVDALVTSAQPQPREPQAASRPPAASAPPKPAATVPVPADGAALLDDVHAFITRFVAFPSEAAAHAVTLWAAHCHAPDSFESTPRVALLSPEPGSGKTRTLEVLELLTPRPMHALNASVAAIFRSIEKARPTLLIDECDAIFTKRGKDDTNEDLRAMLNAGHRKGAVVPRCTGTQHDVTLFPVYAAVALAGLGDLPATLMSRSVVIRMRRRAPGEHVEPFRARLAAADAKPLADRLAAWMEHAAAKLAGSYPEMPPGITDRPADVWEPLIAVADAAGGDWPKRARAACTELAVATETGEASLGVRLLTDLADIFGADTELPTTVILDRLTALEESPWAALGRHAKALDARGLAARLRAYGIRSDNLPRDDGGARLKGYFAASLADAWMRYVPGTRTTAPPAPPATPQVDDLPAGADTGPGADTPAPPIPSAPLDEALTSTDADGAGGADVREPGADICTVCGLALDPCLAAFGDTTHPMCDPKSSVRNAGRKQGRKIQDDRSE
jgi:hypothetical protein